MYACKCTCLHVCLPVQACAGARGQVSAHTSVASPLFQRQEDVKCTWSSLLH